MKTILVTGAAGFIGSHTIDRLIARGYRVIGVDNLRTGRLGNIAGAILNGLEFNEFDILDSVRFDRLVRKARVDAIVHLAALVSVTESIANPEVNFRLNLEATYRVAEAARKHRVPRLVFASSAAVYGDISKMHVKERSILSPKSPYGAAKLASEQLLLSYAYSYGITVRIQRYFNVYGLRQEAGSPYSGVISLFVRKLQQGEAVTIYGDGLQTRDFVHVDDVARANVLASSKVGVETGVANICTGKSTSVRGLLNVLSRLTGSKCAPIHAAARLGDIRSSVGSNRTAAQKIGFVAKVSVTEGLTDLVQGRLKAVRGSLAVV